MLALAEGRLVLDIEQVAEQLHISEGTIRRLVREGKLRAYRIGGRRGKLRFKPEDVTSYLESAVVRPHEGDEEGEAQP